MEETSNLDLQQTAAAVDGTPPVPPQQVAASGTGKVKKPIYKRWWFWVGIIIIAIAFSGGDEPPKAPVAGGQSSGSPAGTEAPVETPIATDYTLLNDVIASTGAMDLAGYTKESVAGVAGALEQGKLTAADADATQSEVDVAYSDIADAVGGLEKPKVYAELSDREYKKLLKDPDSFEGKTYVIWGEVFQFDAATGNDSFLANSGYKKMPLSYGYSQYSDNSMYAGDEKVLANVLSGDLFSAKVTVIGSYSYDTQAGGATTVPSFYVDSIKVYDSVE